MRCHDGIIEIEGCGTAEKRNGALPVARVPPERKEPIMITTLCAAALLAAAVFVLAGCIATAAL